MGTAQAQSAIAFFGQRQQIPRQGALNRGTAVITHRLQSQSAGLALSIDRAVKTEHAGTSAGGQGGVCAQCHGA